MAMTQQQLNALRRPCRSFVDQRDPAFCWCVRCGAMGLNLILTVDVQLDPGRCFLPEPFRTCAWHASVAVFDCGADLGQAIPETAVHLPPPALCDDDKRRAIQALREVLEGVGGTHEFCHSSPSTFHHWRSLTGLERELAFGRVD